MEKDLLLKFVDKLLEVFQSNHVYKKNLLVWLNFLFTHHFFSLASLNNEKLNSLKQIQSLITFRTKNLNNLLQVQSKLENLVNLFDKIELVQENKKNIHSLSYEPLLVYNESDSEEEINKGKNFLILRIQ